MPKSASKQVQEYIKRIRDETEDPNVFAVSRSHSLPVRSFLGDDIEALFIASQNLPEMIEKINEWCSNIERIQSDRKPVKTGIPLNFYTTEKNILMVEIMCQERYRISIAERAVKASPQPEPEEEPLVFAEDIIEEYKRSKGRGRGGGRGGGYQDRGRGGGRAHQGRGHQCHNRGRGYKSFQKWDSYQDHHKFAGHQSDDERELPLDFDEFPPL